MPFSLLKLSRIDFTPAARRRLFARSGVVTAVILCHLVLLLLLILPQERVHQPPPGLDGAMVLAELVVATPADAASPAPVKRTTVAPPKPRAAPAADSSPTASAQADPVAVATPITPPGEPLDGQPVLSSDDADALSQFQPTTTAGQPDAPCDLTSAVVRDFAHSAAARRGVDELPTVEKSVANAVQMWDGAWPSETQAGGKALLRELLTREIASSRPDCLQQPNQGPVFVFVPDGEATVVVAVGSGVWHWGQLVE